MGCVSSRTESRSFNYAFVRKEAVLSSQIEGFRRPTDLLTYEADPEQESADLQEVCNYLMRLLSAATTWRRKGSRFLCG